jgi:hypothetical protein
VAKKHIGSRVANMNNGSVADSSVTAVVICAKKPKGYAMLSTTVESPAGQQTGSGTGCAVGVPLGGGVLSNGEGLGVNIGSPAPNGGWIASENNASVFLTVRGRMTPASLWSGIASFRRQKHQ